MTNISFNITYLQDNYLGTYVSMNKSITYTQMAAVLAYLCTLCFLLRASDWSSNVQRRKCRTLPFTRNSPVTSAPWVRYPQDMINTQVIYWFSYIKWSVQVNVLLNICKQNITSLSLLVDTTVCVSELILCHKVV